MSETTRLLPAITGSGDLASSHANYQPLADKIVDLYRRGVLPQPFGVDDIRAHFRQDYTDSHIRGVLANYCTGTGYWATDARTARFQRHSRGKYFCI